MNLASVEPRRSNPDSVEPGNPPVEPGRLNPDSVEPGFVEPGLCRTRLVKPGLSNPAGPDSIEPGLCPSSCLFACLWLPGSCELSETERGRCGSCLFSSFSCGWMDGVTDGWMDGWMVRGCLAPLHVHPFSYPSAPSYSSSASLSSSCPSSCLLACSLATERVSAAKRSQAAALPFPFPPSPMAGWMAG